MRSLLLSVCFSITLFSNTLPQLHAQQESSTESIFNEPDLNTQLKGKTKEEIRNVLGNPTVVKPCLECDQKLEYWWYYLANESIFVHFRDGKVYAVRIVKRGDSQRL